LDRPGSHRDRDRRPTALLSSEALRGVCLERTIELDNVRLSARDWPGLGRTIVHSPDPLSGRSVIARLAALAPTYRVLSVIPRASVPFQVASLDLVGVLDQFGFVTPVLVGEGLGCVPVVLVAAWYPERMGGLVLVDATWEASSGDGVEAQALRDCPPDWAALRSRVNCGVLELRADDAALVPRVEAFAAAPLP
jgi:pimeloyl-ACP methyl ester carboxylesterase